MSIERYVRRDNTELAVILRTLAPTVGRDYLTSRAKRRLDVYLGTPVAVLSVPLVLLLTVTNRLLHPGQSALFLQWRVGSSGRPLLVVKIRTIGAGGWLASYGRKAGSFRQILRQYHLDELPQLWEVVAGRLTLVGIRVLPRRVYRELERAWSPARFAAWQQAYFTTPLGLTGVHQVFRGAGKEDERRFHRDLFYASHASLGFDLYLLWRTMRRIGQPN